MMFIILTPDSQSTLPSFSLFLIFATSSPVAEKALFGSINLGLIVIKGMEQFFKIIL